MTGYRSRLLLIISLFIIAIFLLAAPALVFAQENGDTTEEELEPRPETLDFDISYSEVMAFGTKGNVFEFEISVTFDGKEERYFEIIKEFPPGWKMDISPGSKTIDIPVLKLKPGSAETLKIKSQTLIDQEPGDYLFRITLRSTSGGDEIEGSTEFTGIVKPDGSLQMRSSTERLNAEVRAGKENIYKILITNTGAAPVEDITLSASGEPEGWQIDLKDSIEIIDVGKTEEVDVIIIPPKRTISGDYTIYLSASSKDGGDNLEIRTAVQAPLVWKIVGIGLIALVIAGIAVIFERLGRR